ncbi:kinase-like domain-containing protein [Rhizoctonia solani]|nr:kinase-like domain-containing protein [Rhizoctonia solani]
MREIYNWSKLEHENVHKLLGVTMFQGRLGMVSIWMEHGTLQQYLNQHNDISRHALVCEIAEGVAYLHGVNMIHGDLKASNILMSPEGIPKLTDFDYSIISDCSLVFSATTRMGGGTLRWMAPELVIDEEPIERNKMTDIYALGMTFLETITGAFPYSECHRDAQIYGKLARREHPKRSGEHFPANVRGNTTWELLVQCWDYDPPSRPIASRVLVRKIQWQYVPKYLLIPNIYRPASCTEHSWCYY